MRRIRLVLAVAAMMVAMLSFSVPAMADVDLDDDWYEERAELVEEYYEELGDAYEDGFLGQPDRFVQRIAAVRQMPGTPAPRHRL